MPVPFREFVQTLHSTLGAADTTASLVTRSQGGVARCPEGALSNAIDDMGAQLTSEIRDARDILQQDIQTVNRMVQQVLDNQIVLREETQRILDGVDHLKGAMREHIQTANAFFRCLIERDLKGACYTLQSDLSGNGVEPPLDDIRIRAKVLEELLMSARAQAVRTSLLKNPSSEFANQFLSQYPDYAGFIAERLQLLFGSLIPDKFLTLPPIKLYVLAAEVYLATLKKHPEIMGKDKGAVVCEEIKRVVTTYIEFIQFLKEKKFIIQALFDQYAYYQRKDDKQNQPIMAEIHGLLKSIVPLVANDKFTAMLSTLESKTASCVVKKIATKDIWDELPKTLPEVDRIRKLSLMLAQDNPLNGSQTKYMLLPETAEYKPIPSQINWALNGAPKGEVTSTWGSVYFPKQPKPPAFVTTPMVLLLLASGYTNVNFFRNSTLKKHVGLLIENCPPTTNTRAVGGIWHTVRFDDVGTVQISGSPDSSGAPPGHSYVRYNGSSYLMENTRLGMASDYRTVNLYTGHPSDRANIFQFHAQLPDNAHSPEDIAVLNSVEKGLLKAPQLQQAYQYYDLVSNGQILSANKIPVDPLCLLFIVALRGRFDILETYVAQHGLPFGFNLDTCIEGSTLSPLSIARKSDHQDVILGLPKIKMGIKPPAKTSEFELACAEMLKNVIESKAKLEKIVPPAPQVTTLPSANDVDEQTDDEQEKGLEGTTVTHFKEQAMHAGRLRFWKKSTERKFAKTGYKVIDDAEFKDTTHRDDFLRILREKHFDAKRLPKEQQILVQLPTIAR